MKRTTLTITLPDITRLYVAECAIAHHALHDPRCNGVALWDYKYREGDCLGLHASDVASDDERLSILFHAINTALGSVRKGHTQ